MSCCHQGYLVPYQVEDSYKLGDNTVFSGDIFRVTRLYCTVCHAVVKVEAEEDG
ncbi:MAG: hypothetical protein UY48_C0013G0019 [Candidatus Gottesmanbacteria bacterium GW2011_GWB1_49_7]|uniref:Uncharacterized protein n=1 Tax=Candidatus Gottesmanbacteria bacterium GW2011_GWB1_49_7 TaxID=1618448 RepID=A0A0G1VZ40_9BACT|nr:MAG: hypothetical protein UY48_C0013G0019 [Candidatus Gottesmanbacteria bacterium GW2011_GWB1_49_7]